MPDSRPRVLCAGVYLADVENTARHVADVLARSREVDIEQRWIGLTTRGSATDLPGTVPTSRGAPRSARFSTACWTDSSFSTGSCFATTILKSRKDSPTR
jgi:hypothetical protein